MVSMTTNHNNNSSVPLKVLKSLHLVSRTKDSVHLTWTPEEEYSPIISGYKIQYQAEGSTVILDTPMLEASRTSYDVQQLHENTYYNMCIKTFFHPSRDMNNTVHVPCLRATTTVDSLHVALGSTFGAFLALGIIVMFVYIAKYQHTRKLKKKLHGNVTPLTNEPEEGDSLAIKDRDIEMSDISLHVNEGQSTKAQDNTSQASQVSGYHSITNQSNRSLDGGNTPERRPSKSEKHAPERRPSKSEKQRSLRRKNSGAHKHLPGQYKPLKTDPQSSSNQPKIHKQRSMERQKSIDQPAENGDAEKCDYGGARPKEFSRDDPRNLYANQAYMDLPQTEHQGLKPQSSCKW